MFYDAPICRLSEQTYQNWQQFEYGFAYDELKLLRVVAPIIWLNVRPFMRCYCF